MFCVGAASCVAAIATGTGASAGAAACAIAGVCDGADDTAACARAAADGAVTLLPRDGPDPVACTGEEPLCFPPALPPLCRGPVIGAGAMALSCTS